MNNHQLNNLSVYYSGDNGTYHLAGRYDIGSNGKITRIDVSAYVKRGEANIEVGKLLSDDNGAIYAGCEKRRTDRCGFRSSASCGSRNSREGRTSHAATQRPSVVHSERIVTQTLTAENQFIPKLKDK